MSKCPHCGAEVQFQPGTQLVHCEYCGSDFQPEEMQEAPKKGKKVATEQIKGNAYVCSQCGATLLTFDETAVTFCSYCGSQNMLEEKMVSQDAPDLIIPFQKTRDDCIKSYKKKVSHSIFAPSYMKSQPVVQKFRGIYMPYGVYNLSYKEDCVNQGSKYNHRSGNYIYYDKYAIHANIDSTYKGMSFDLLSNFYDEYSQSIPFDSRSAVPFNANYLPGFYADSKDVPIGTYSDDAIKIASVDSTNYFKHKAFYRKYSCSCPTVPYHVEEKKLGFFPVYFLSVRDQKDDKKLYYAIINGQTGKVVADLPIDFIKYIIISILLSVPIFFLLMKLPTITPTAIVWFTILASIVCIFICFKQGGKVQEREARWDDKGYDYYLRQNQVTDAKKSRRVNLLRKKKIKLSQYIKLLIAILLSLGVVILHPVDDLYYYLISFASCILILFSFYDLVKLHNQLVSRPIPQLHKRGGDEHE